MSEDTNVEATEAAPAAEQTQGPDLTVQDLQALKSL